MTALDAAGLALFAVAGAVNALEFRMHPFIAALMGAVTGCGGGVVRDVLLARIPVVLVADIYASAALLGAALVVSSRRAGCPPVVAAVLVAAACFALRIAAVRYGLQLPKLPAGAGWRRLTIPLSLSARLTRGRSPTGTRTRNRRRTGPPGFIFLMHFS
ncbi:trimeric intracellular cation channel family protein [Burkholderia pseudomallei]|uniref:trimeric intracellular cation channel family protein n=1 Tax=Burkholderia pseudomallei TaxID=28450 RepID=UPI00387ACEC7